MNINHSQLAFASLSSLGTWVVSTRPMSRLYLMKCLLISMFGLSCYPELWTMLMVDLLSQ